MMKDVRKELSVISPTWTESRTAYRRPPHEHRKYAASPRKRSSAWQGCAPPQNPPHCSRVLGLSATATVNRLPGEA
jgi:hypothetical protein